MQAEKIEKVELTEEEKRKRLDDHYQRIKEMECEVGEYEHELVGLTRQLKEAKKMFDGAVAALRNTIHRDPLYVPPVVEDPQLKLEFEQGYDKRLDAAIEEALELTQKQIEKLDEAGVKTVGDFEKLRGGQMKDYPGGLSDLPRVGQATIDKWEDEIVEFLKVSALPLVDADEEDEEDDEPQDD